MTAEASTATTRGRFPGFPAGMRAIPVPALFFSHLLPRIEDEAELRVTLYVIYALSRRKGYPRFVTKRELAAEAPLLASLGDASPEIRTIGADTAAVEKLARGLDGAVRRGVLLSLDLEQAGRIDTLYLLNSPSDKRALDQIKRGRLDLGRPLPAESEPPAAERGNVFQLYEENIGPMTPLVAEELQEAERLYPFDWLEDAFREAAHLNKRSWRYVSRILERWATEGRRSEKAGPDLDGAESARAQIIRRYRGLGGD